MQAHAHAARAAAPARREGDEREQHRHERKRRAGKDGGQRPEGLQPPEPSQKEGERKRQPGEEAEPAAPQRGAATRAPRSAGGAWLIGLASSIP